MLTSPIHRILFLPSQTAPSEPLTAQVSINDVNLEMEIDTGASLSILSEMKYRELLQKGVQLSLEPSQVSLKTYMGESLKVLSSIQGMVKYEGQVKELSLLVVPGKGPALLGHNWLSKLKVKPNIFHVDATDGLERLLNNHVCVFGQDLGCLKGTKAKLYVDSQVKPKFLNPDQCLTCCGKKWSRNSSAWLSRI